MNATLVNTAHCHHQHDGGTKSDHRQRRHGAVMKTEVSLSHYVFSAGVRLQDATDKFVLLVNTHIAADYNTVDYYGLDSHNCVVVLHSSSATCMRHCYNYQPRRVQVMIYS